MTKSTRRPQFMPTRRQFTAGMGALGALGVSGIVPRALAQAGNWRAYEGTELRMLMVNHWWTESIQKQLPQFEELTGMSVTFDILAEDNYYTKAAVELSAGTRNYDGLMVGNLQAGQYMAADWLAPLGSYLGDSDLVDPAWYRIDDIFGSGRAAGTSADMLYALPISTECEVLLYRTDLFEQAGIAGIDTLDEMIAAATALNQDGVSGMVGRGRRGLDLIWVWTGFLLSAGGDFFKDGKAALNSDEAKSAADIYINKLLKENGPPGTANMSWLEASAVFKDGNAAMYPDASGLLTVALDPDKSVITDSVGVLAWPGQGSHAPAPNYWFWLYGVPKNTGNPEAAALFTAWATSPDVAMTMGSTTGSPVARQSVWDAEVFTQFYPGDAAAQISKSLASVQPKRVPFSDPKFPEVVDVVAVDLVNVLTGDTDVDAAMENANAEVTRIMEG